MTPPAAAETFIAAAGLSVRMREAVDLIVQNGALQRLRATEACAANPYQPNLVWAPSIFGTPLELDLREEVCAAIFTYGVFDAPLLAFLSRTLKEGDVFFDVGAHIGYFTVAASMLVGDTGRVVSFEPMPQTFNRLTVNTRNTGRSNITIVNAAAWSEDAHIRIRDFGPDASAFNSVYASRRSSEGEPTSVETVEVKALRLDGYMAESEIRPHVIKIDVESAESEVLNGLGEALRGAGAPIVVIEVGDFAHLVEKGVPTSASLLNSLVERGYALFELDPDGGLVPHSIKSDGYSYMNIVCAPTHRSVSNGTIAA